MSQEAVENNAHWCDAVCREQGIRTRFTDGLWVALQRSPDFYPDAVTLTPDVTPEEVLRDIDTSAGCSVKDSHATLNLSAYGFELLFEASWIHLPAPPGKGPTWIAETLFGDPDISRFSGPEGSVIANVTGPVVGLSNLRMTGEADTAWGLAVRSLAAWRPGMPIVGYESGEDLAAAERAGFTTTGPLRVWLKP